MVKLRVMQPMVRVIDTRTVKVAPKIADAELQTAQHREWRAQVLRNAGYRCQAIEHGERCTKAYPKHRMFADHIVERRDGGSALDPRNGQCLCGAHHTSKTVAARSRRLASR
jgi:hypothetical protein